MSFTFAPATPRRRPSLTPMIDVVFLLLVFFMLAARFGQEAEVSLTTASDGAADWPGPPRLVDVGASGLELNGAPTDPDAMIQTLTGLTETEADPILLRPDAQIDTQRLLDVMAALRSAGFSNLILVAP